jgi:predicted esterase
MSFHGMCASAELECPFYVEGSTRESWLLCPDGNTPCDGGGLMWAGSPKKQAEIQDESVRTLRAMYPENTRTGGVLVGYSLGANAALSMLARQPAGNWTGLVIINSSTVPTPEELRRAGVTRVALVAGDHDMTAGALSIAAPKLRKAGLDARYFSLGKVGHFFDETTSQRMIAPLRWVIQTGSTPSAERTADSRSSIE